MTTCRICGKLMWPGGCLMETMENHGMDAEFNFESALEDYLSTDFGDLEEGRNCPRG